jgi:hypothetical protein
MTHEQRIIKSELAVFAPVLNKSLRDFSCRKDEAIDLLNYLHHKSLSTEVIPPYTKFNLGNGVLVQFKQSKSHADYWYFKVILKRLTINS